MPIKGFVARYLPTNYIFLRANTMKKKKIIISIIAIIAVKEKNLKTTNAH